MRRSKAVPLLVLGTMVTLPGCSPDQPVDLQQNRYLSREDCQKDWGDDQNCTPAPGPARNGNGSGGGGTGGGGYGGSGYYYFGPRYYWDLERNRPVTVAPNGETRVVENTSIGRGSSALHETFHVGPISRGGFGGFGHGFSLGG